MKVKMSAVPCSLVMTKMECFYCNKKDTGAAEISPNFGLKYCDDHKAASARDCRAYLHSHKMAALFDAFNYPATKPFMNMVVDQVTFPVMRSSGEIQDGWRLNVAPPFEPSTFICNIQGVWMLPVVKYGDIGIRKDVPIIDFIKVAKFPEDVVHRALGGLEAGIYLNDFNEVEMVLGHQDPLELGL